MAERERKSSRFRVVAVAFDRLYRTFQKKFTVGRGLIGMSVFFLLVAETYVSYRCPTPEPRDREILSQKTPPTYMLHGDGVDSGYLSHVIAVLERLGFRRTHNSSDFDLLWSHVYPFGELAPFPKPFLQNLRPFQKVNHFPGCGYFTNKVDLAVSDLKDVPKAFHLPSQKQQLLQYTKKHPHRLFVQKRNSHRGIKILKVEDMNLDLGGTFVQEYVQNPFLIDGYKFDIGIYAVLTSVDPLRVYIYDGDVLLRFCSKKYEPFDPDDVDKYVVGDDYIPIWEIPSLKKSYNHRKLGMKETLNTYIRKIGKDPLEVWARLENSIVELLLQKEEKILGITRRYRNVGNFFEMVRFDYILDADLNAYLMETNMSPNLSSDHFPPNRLLYENVLFGLFSLVGVARRTKYLTPSSVDEEKMEAPDKNLVVFGDECSAKLCDDCGAPYCTLCHHCMTPHSLALLKHSYLEHVNKIDYKRIFPPKMSPKLKLEDVDLERYSPENRFMVLWFLGKCYRDESWVIRFLGIDMRANAACLALVSLYLLRVVRRDAAFHADFPYNNHTRLFLYLSDVARFQLLNPTIINVTHWERKNESTFFVQYTERLSQIPGLRNYAHAVYRTNQNENGSHELTSQHLTCFFVDFMCLSTDSTVRVSQISESEVRYREEISYGCPWIFVNFCFEEIAFQRTLIVSNLKKIFLLQESQP